MSANSINLKSDDRTHSWDGRKLRVLLLDDCSLHRQALRTILEDVAGAHVIEGATREEAVDQFRRLHLDVIVLSFTFGESNGLGLIKGFLDQRPSIKVLVLSERPRASYASRSLASGAAGYISKSASTHEFIAALSSISLGKVYLDPEIATKLALKRVRGAADIADGLTVREQEILRLIGEGKDISSIAATFGVAYKTIANACSRVKAKLDVKCTSELVKIAYELNDE